MFVFDEIEVPNCFTSLFWISTALIFEKKNNQFLIKTRNSLSVIVCRKRKALTLTWLQFVSKLTNTYEIFL